MASGQSLARPEAVVALRKRAMEKRERAIEVSERWRAVRESERKVEEATKGKEGVGGWTQLGKREDWKS